MSDLHLSQFPLEILDIIVSYLPRSDLDKLDGIDYLKGPVLRNIYSSVTITGCIPHDSKWTGPSPQQYFMEPKSIDRSEFYCLESLTDFLEENHLPFPRHIYFYHPIDIIVAYDKNSSILQNCIIETDLELFDDLPHYTLDLSKFYLQKLISLPLKIRHVRYCEIMHELMGESTIEFTRKLTDATFLNECPLELVFGGNKYQNLVNLAIGDQISHEMVKHIPRSVKAFKCQILCSGFELTEFDFPDGLEKLRVSLIDYPKEHSLSFSNLKQLVDLYFDLADYDNEASLCNVSFPKSLKSVRSHALNIEEIKNQCPELTSLYGSTNGHTEIKGNSFNFPEKLTYLSVVVDVFEHIETLENNSAVVPVNDTKRRKPHSASIKLPKNLQSLYVIGDSWVDGHEVEFDESLTLFSNKEENILHNLTSMKLFNLKSFMRFGPIPQSLTHLECISSEYRIESLDRDFFDNLKNATNLKVLKISSPLDSSFECELPPKLQCFEFFNPNLSKITLRSRSLQILRLKGGKFNEVTSESVQIPESLVELLMIKCGIIGFDKSFTFPKNLQILDLHGNDLKRIHKLPPNLKSFSSYYSAPKLDQSVVDELPTTLEELDLKHYGGHVEGSEVPDFCHLVNLKKLCLDSFLFMDMDVVSVDLDNFPESLTKLSMEYCQIQEFEGTFADFPKLEHLYLKENRLARWLSSSPDEFSFGAAIRTIVLDYNNIHAGIIRNLIFKLKENPNFKSLSIGPTPVSRDVKHLVMERYLIQGDDDDDDYY
ncbi:hypothetical protein G210_3514 [Candida maltosa Xu316]|uniref:Uncharacterized protein n=1 Tax=Candida maltosa (strain Xu316) TaxID=1245528 RepID=M3HG61_CANMX|nr:hypothetical protein G210_3514 [Candida maltosa Xu316]